jgi:hypothetical protein
MVNTGASNTENATKLTNTNLSALSTHSFLLKNELDFTSGKKVHIVGSKK